MMRWRDIVALFPTNVRRFFDRIDEALRLLGDSRDRKGRAVTVRDLETGESLAELLPDGVRGKAAKLLGVPDGYLDTVPPEPPRNVAVVSTGLTSVDLQWDRSPSRHAAYYEVLRAPTDQAGQAETVLVVRADENTDTYRATDPIGETGVTAYYWVRTISHAGVRGALHATNGLVATTGQVSASDFDPNTTAIQIVDTLPATATEGDVVFLRSNAKIYRYDGAQWTTRVDGDDIAANAVDWATHISGPGKPQDNADVTALNTAADTYAVNGTAADVVATAVANFNADNDMDGSPINSTPVIATDGTAIDHVVNTDGSVDISFQWDWTGTESIDGFQVFVHVDTASTQYVFGTDPASEMVYTVPANSRALLLSGKAADKYYTIGIRAYRAVNTTVDASGVIASAIVKSTATGEDPYQPSANVAFAGDIIGTVAGVDSTLLTQQAADGAAAWGKFSGAGNTLPAGEVEFAFAGSTTKGGNALNTDAVGSFAASDVEASVLNYNTRNDRNSKALVAPVVFSGAITHTLNTDGSANVSFQWGFSGLEDDIDGFIIYAYRADAAGTRTIDGTEPAYYVTPRHRAFTLEGVPADAYYQFGVRSYRIVDPDIAPGGALLSSIVQDGTTLYQPAANVAFQGVVGGATYSDGTPIDDLQPRDPAATAGADWDADLANRPKQWLFVSEGGNGWQTNPGLPRGVYDEADNLVFRQSRSYGLVEFSEDGAFIRGRTFDVYGGAIVNYCTDSEHVAGWAMNGGASSTITRRDDVKRPDGYFGWAADATVYEVFFATGELGRVKCPIFGLTSGDIVAGVWLKTADGTSKSLSLNLRENDASVTYGNVTITVTGDWQLFIITGTLTTAPTDLRLWVYHSDSNWPDTTLHVWGAFCKPGTAATADNYAYSFPNAYGRVAGHLAAQIRLAPENRILAVVTFDEPRNARLNDRLPDAIKAMGGSRAVFENPDFEYRSAYMLIGKKFLGSGNGIEFYSGKNTFLAHRVAMKRGLFATATATPDVEGGSDNTTRAIESVVTINDQGAIQNASWGTGTKKIKIDFANQRIAIGDDVYGSSIPHVLQEYNAGNPRFELTAGGERFFRMDAQAGVMELGRDIDIAGVDKFSNSSLYHSIFFDHVPQDWIKTSLLEPSPIVKSVSGRLVINFTGQLDERVNVEVSRDARVVSGGAVISVGAIRGSDDFEAYFYPVKVIGNADSEFLLAIGEVAGIDSADNLQLLYGYGIYIDKLKTAYGVANDDGVNLQTTAQSIANADNDTLFKIEKIGNTVYFSSPQGYGTVALTVGSSFAPRPQVLTIAAKALPGRNSYDNLELGGFKLMIKP